MICPPDGICLYEAIEKYTGTYASIDIAVAYFADSFNQAGLSP